MKKPLEIKEVQAETALAKGITAQKRGTIVEALMYYTEAVFYNTSMTEADQRLAVLSQEMESGDIGENIRNDIEHRGAWKKLLEEAIAFYQQTPYFTMVYCTIPQIGKTDYSKNTAAGSYNLWIEPNTGYAAMLKILRALWSTGKTKESGNNSCLMLKLCAIQRGFCPPVKLSIAGI